MRVLFEVSKAKIHPVASKNFHILVTIIYYERKNNRESWLIYIETIPITTVEFQVLCVHNKFILNATAYMYC